MNILICANGKRDSVMKVLLSIWPNCEATGLPMWIENYLEGLNFIRYSLWLDNLLTRQELSLNVNNAFLFFIHLLDPYGYVTRPRIDMRYIQTAQNVRIGKLNWYLKQNS